MKAVGAIRMPRWSREQYEKMIATGIFPPGTRAELIDGEISSMTPQKRQHAAAIRAAEEALRIVFETGYDVQVQLPLALDPSSEPEPDLSVMLHPSVRNRPLVSYGWRRQGENRLINDVSGDPLVRSDSPGYGNS